MIMEKNKEELNVKREIPDPKDKRSSDEMAGESDMTLKELPLNMRTVIDSLYKSRELRH